MVMSLIATTVKILQSVEYVASYILLWMPCARLANCYLVLNSTPKQVAAMTLQIGNSQILAKSACACVWLVFKGLMGLNGKSCLWMREGEPEE